jgi:pimeloyl-ACP methyl ester carboxylesterase
MEVIRLAPARVTRLALLDTNPLAEPAERAAARDEQIGRAYKLGLSSVIRDEVKPQYLADGPRVAPILDTCLAMAESLGIDTFVNQSRALQTRRDQCVALRNVAVPTLILCGEHDSLCPVERHRLMQSLVPGATLAIIPGAGHLPTLEQPALTNTALAEWLHR